MDLWYKILEYCRYPLGFLWGLVLLIGGIWQIVDNHLNYNYSLFESIFYGIVPISFGLGLIWISLAKNQ